MVPIDDTGGRIEAGVWAGEWSVCLESAVCGSCLGLNEAQIDILIAPVRACESLHVNSHPWSCLTDAVTNFKIFCKKEFVAVFSGSVARDAEFSGDEVEHSRHILHRTVSACQPLHG